MRHCVSPQVCLEADPGTFDLQRLLQYRSLGFTRLSVGVQSLQLVCVCILLVGSALLLLFSVVWHRK